MNGGQFSLDCLRLVHVGKGILFPFQALKLKIKSLNFCSNYSLTFGKKIVWTENILSVSNLSRLVWTGPNRAFSYDVTAATTGQPYWCTKLFLGELKCIFMQKSSFVLVN